MQPIHDRMPVIPPPDLEALWLDDEIQDAAALVSLLSPYPADAWTQMGSPPSSTPLPTTGLNC